MPTPIRIAIADGDAFLRRRLIHALGDGARIVGSTGDPSDVESLCLRERPDVLLLGLRGDGAADIRLLTRLRRIHPMPAVLVLGDDVDPHLVLELLVRGAAGIVGRQLRAPVLQRVLETVAAGEVVVTRSVTTLLVRRLREAVGAANGLRPVQTTLSGRQWEVLDLLRGGVSTAGIARQLDISPGTVRSHVKAILRRLDAHSRDEAVERSHLLLAEPGRAFTAPPAGSLARR